MLVAKTISVMNGSSNFCPLCSVRKVHAGLERHDPPVQQVARRARLPAEVVDDQHAAVRDRLNRRVVEARRRRVRELQRLQRELATDHHHRPPAANPAAIEPSFSSPGIGAIVRNRLVVDRVEQPDDVAFDFERVRDGDGPSSRLCIACEMTVLPFPGGP